MKFRCNLVSIVGVLLMAGCSMSPPIVEPKVSLVEQAPDISRYRQVPQQYWADLNHASSGTEIVHNNNVISVGQHYFSALGMSCRNLNVSKAASMSEQLVVCKDTNAAWYIVPQIIDRESQPVFAEQ
ncbi:hypothetical protein EXU30_03600 [Shewanella maritima]|uniref:Lipoprotein n=1 Tax=Shewanella maritima TaxID=2520507 RepID=A0A411PEC3_9GAMM|nr:DVU3141 family protein [Shewanella maritima]QBF81883.1 hypothetical protein EXU30_03600 [Shewanella maritima]